MTDTNVLRDLATSLEVNFTRPLSHAQVRELADFWIPDINFHEVERFHSIDLDDMYAIPAEQFETLDAQERQEFAVEFGEQLLTPPVVSLDGEVRGFGLSVRDALLEADVTRDAVYTHGKSLRRSEKFFASETPLTGPENPAIPRHPLKARAEFRMLLETLKFDLLLAGKTGSGASVDAIWGDFDVTDMLLRRVDPETGRDDGPARQEVRHDFALELIKLFENEDAPALQALLEEPPNDGGSPTRVNRTVWLALSTCGFLEYYFVYSYNDWPRYGGVFTNEHEGDIEGCCLPFSRHELQLLLDGGRPDAVAPLALITSVHNESNRADEIRPVDRDPGDARDGLDVFVARGSHATYLNAGTHDFFDLDDPAGESTALAVLVISVLVLFPAFAAHLFIYEHFNGDPDETSDDGVTGQGSVDPTSDPETHLPVEILTTALSDILNPEDANIYSLDQPSAQALAVRAFKGRLGHDTGIIDKSPNWGNKTRRYFKQLVKGLDSGMIRSPSRPVI